MVGESPGEPSRGRFHALGLCDCGGILWGESRKVRHSSALGLLAQLVRGLGLQGRGGGVSVTRYHTLNLAKKDV